VPATSAAAKVTMAPNNDASKVTDKGKGKATDGKAEESKKGKDGQPQATGKKTDDKVDGKLHFQGWYCSTAIFGLANSSQLPRN
jgi:hypothetical protein